MPLVLRMSARRVAPSGPVFISYRQSDGMPTAVALAWLLRAAGVPVWQDQTDLHDHDLVRDSDSSAACSRRAGSAGLGRQFQENAV